MPGRRTRRQAMKKPRNAARSGASESGFGQAFRGVAAGSLEAYDDFESADGCLSPGPRERFQSAATPALATCASSPAFTPETPTAPITWPSSTTGTPPSSEVISGAVTKAVRPPLTMSS